ncbi:nuclease domain-containing protein [Pseudomonas granadensis]|uniref:nuclease domain-containing protein n=1 Tax=Pseudomonas granadensis TaxID=1421430 RepID=UPI0038B4A267
MTIVTQLQRQFPELVWRREYRSVGAKEIVWRGRAANVTVEACYQVRCPAIDRTAHRGFQSLSRERYPDIVVTLDSPSAKRFVVFDAKYRSARASVLDAMESAHLYHDSLRWKGIKPDVSLLLIPRADKVRALVSPTYHADYGVGAWQIGAESEGEALGIELKRILSAIPIAAAPARTIATGTAR